MLSEAILIVCKKYLCSHLAGYISSGLINQTEHTLRLNPKKRPKPPKKLISICWVRKPHIQ